MHFVLVLFLALAGIAFTDHLVAAQTGKDKDKAGKDKTAKDKDSSTGDKDKEAPPPIKYIGGRTVEKWIEKIPLADCYESEMGTKMVLAFPLDQASKAVPVLLQELEKHRSKGGDLSVRVNIAIALAALLA